MSAFALPGERFPAARQIVHEKRLEIIGFITFARDNDLFTQGVVTWDQIHALVEQVNAADDELDAAQ